MGDYGDILMGFQGEPSPEEAEMDMDEFVKQLGQTNSGDKIFLQKELENLENGIHGKKRHDGKYYLWGGPTDSDWTSATNAVKQQKWEQAIEELKRTVPQKVDGKFKNKKDQKLNDKIKYALNILHNERCRSKYLRDRGYRRNPHPLFDYKIGDKGVYKHVTKCVECDPKKYKFHSRNRKAGDNKDGCILNTLGKKGKRLTKAIPKIFKKRISADKVINPNTMKAIKKSKAREEGLTFINHKGEEQPVHTIASGNVGRMQSAKAWIRRIASNTRKAKPKITVAAPQLPALKLSNSASYRDNLEKLYRMKAAQKRENDRMNCKIRKYKIQNNKYIVKNQDELNKLADKACQLSDKYLETISKIQILKNKSYQDDVIPGIGAGFKRTRKRRRRKTRRKRRRKRKGTKRR